MVLGEPQILGQLKDAFRQAEQTGTVGSQLKRLFHHTFSVAKKVRTDTEIGSSPVSVAYAAVNLANQFFAGFTKHTALLIGAGTTIELVARHLSGKGIGRMFVANRNFDRAQNIASQFDGFALPLSEIEGHAARGRHPDQLNRQHEPIVTTEQMTQRHSGRESANRFLRSTSLCREISKRASASSMTYISTRLTISTKSSSRARSNRETAAARCRSHSQDETQRYLSIERSKEVAPIITALRDHGDTLRHEVLEQARRRLAKGADPDEVLEFVTASLLKKILHQPSVRLREAGEQSDQAFIDSHPRTLRPREKD